MDQIIKINFFGGLHVEINETVLQNGINKLSRHYKLLAYLVAYKNISIPAEKLVHAVYGDIEINAQALNALKNTVYCLRKELGDNSFIIFSGNGYMLNNDNTILTDTENFDKLTDLLKTTDDTEKKIPIYQSIIDLYKGDFLPQLNNEHWVMEKSLYYKNKYVNTIIQYLRILYDNRQYGEILKATGKASLIDPRNQTFYLYMFKALYQLNKHTIIINTYMKIDKIFRNEFNLVLCDEIKEIFEKSDKKYNKIELKLSVIKDDLKESANDRASVKGPFFCSFDVFKQIYQLKVRSAAREESRVILLLLTIADENKSIPESNVLLDAMLELKEVILNTIRKNDVFTQYSKAQYLLMVSADSTQKAKTALLRIENNYQSYLNKNMLTLASKFSLQDY